MGIPTTLGALALVGVGIYAVIKIVPGLIGGLSLGTPQIPNPLKDLTDFLKQQSIRGDPNAEINFSPEEGRAFDFRELIGRPKTLSAESFPQGNGMSIQQIDPNAPAPTDRFFFGSDFASASRLSDLLNRFKSTGRDVPGGRSKRITMLIEERDQQRSKQIASAAFSKRTGSSASTAISNLTNAQILGQRRTLSNFSIGGGQGISRTGKLFNIGSSVFANASKQLAPAIRRRRR